MRYLRRLVEVAVSFAFCLLPFSFAQADVLDELRDRLFERRQALREVEERIAEYRGEVTERREQASTLQGQIRVIEQQVQRLTLELDKTAVEVETVQAESAAVAEEIRRAEEEIARKREQLRAMVRLLQVLESDSAVETFIKYPSLTAALTELRAVSLVQQRTSATLGEVRQLRQSLDRRLELLGNLQRELLELQSRQESQKKTLEEQETAKSRLFEVTKAQEVEFQTLLDRAAAEHRRSQAEIARVEAEVRSELERRGLIKLGGVGILDWPIDPIFGVACGFHCPDYPYQHILGPHSGIDLPTHMGTPVRAAAEGYVARAYDSGGPGYSYLLILHGDNLSTVYGHLSSVGVADGDFVARGQLIGSTGGAPGSRGAGLSTGPHLHLEVRKDGLPVDPARYLP